MSHSFLTSFSGRRVLPVVAASGLALASLAACTFGGSPAGELGRDQSILAACGKGPRPAVDVQLDGTGSSASAQIAGERLAAVEQLVRTAAVCGGRVRVAVFSSSSATETVLFEGALPLAGATTNARLRRVPRVVGRVVTQVRRGYGPAVRRLDRGGSDITGAYRLAGEWSRQLGSGYRLRLFVFTDGFQNVGPVKLSGAALANSSHVRGLAERVSMPALPGSWITVAGLGRVAGKPPSSAVVEGLVAFYDAVCRRAGASRCVSVSDDAVAGQ
ncbi:hypothetical protein BTM25_24220 [Actinomadura rubteroloni]|uniref:VWA domain-containing protein n=1 Tax=Actinomadura rubteroloni TaxID=1926885 RepID=A0A2P4UFH7_9ACTN|nr:hypothetical protein [Actinomadura rubteroloni]POM23796.1 hypothetical protein BTM25_24220 [Actinomadura rubteroloni]